MNIVEICGIAVIGLTAVMVLRTIRPEYAMLAGILTGLILLAAAVLELSSVIGYIQDMTDSTGFSLYSSVILKSLGIGILAQTTADICRDSGETAIASKVEFAAKIISKQRFSYFFCLAGINLLQCFWCRKSKVKL